MFNNAIYMHIHVLNMPKRPKKNYILNYSKDTRKRNEEIVFSIYMLTEQFLIVFDLKKKYKNYTIYVC